MDTNKDVKTTEEDKFESEVNKNNAEINKLKLESLEIKERLNKKWYTTRFFLEATVGGIVGSALLVAWLVGYLSPVLSAKHELASLKNSKISIEIQLEKESNIKLKQEIDKKVKLHKVQIEDLHKARTIAEERAKSLQAQLLSLQGKYKDLATNEISEEERKKFQNLVETTQAEVNNLKSFIDKIQYEKDLALSQSEKSSQSIDIKDNKKYIIAIYALASSEKQYLEIHDYFSTHGYIINDDSNLNDKPKWMAIKSSILYYDEKNRNKANELAKAMNKITKNKFNVQRGAGHGLRNGQSEYKIVIHYIP